MRLLSVLVLFSATPAFAAAPQCTLPNAAPFQIADVAAPAQMPSSASLSTTPAQAAPPSQLPAALVSSTFAQHEAAVGASIIDLGSSHGLKSFIARSGNQFMVFQVTPDGQAAVSGAQTDLTVEQLTAAAGGNVTPLTSQHGLDALFVRSGNQFQVFYVTPDRERVIPGVMWDASGKDLTRDQVANVPGAVPTVVVGDVPAAQGGVSQQPVAPTGAVLPLLEKANFGTVGSASAPHLWMLIDPQCIYSVRAYQMLHPFIEAGRVQLSIIPLSVLDYEDRGQSTKSALALLSKPADQLAAAWQAGSVNDPPVPAAASRLQANMAIAQAVGLTGTPMLVWRKADGSEGRLDGAPTNVEALIASIGAGS